jgi:hypothetical protein
LRLRVRTPLLLGLCTALAVTVGASVASATTTRVPSQPNGDIAVTVSTGSETDRDHDGDFNTVTKNDIAARFYAVANNSGITQTIRIDYVVDGPGTEFDRAFTQEVVLAPSDIYQTKEDFKVTRSMPHGQYTLTVTGSGTETATASAFYTLS